MGEEHRRLMEPHVKTEKGICVACGRNSKELSLCVASGAKERERMREGVGEGKEREIMICGLIFFFFGISLNARQQGTCLISYGICTE